MKLKFEKNIDYQIDAINSIVRIFEGNYNGLINTEYGMANNLVLSQQQILARVQKIQEANNIDITPSLDGMQFSVEMETGTGKTYVYLRTIYELNKTYGFSKFCIVVPGIAVREGVMQTIRATTDHFKEIYGLIPEAFIYDSTKVSSVQQFAGAQNTIQIMIINIDSFKKDISDDTDDFYSLTDEEQSKVNIFNRPTDKTNGVSAKEYVASSNPIIIIDEPQSVDNTESAKEAIKKLNPLFTLRYSATHKNTYNLMYRLTPVDAFQKELVKRIEIASSVIYKPANSSIRLLKTDNSKNKITVKLEITDNTGKIISVNVSKGNNLYEKSKRNSDYKNNYIVSDIDCTTSKEYIEFENGESYDLSSANNENSLEIIKSLINQTIEYHLTKELTLQPKGIKVLSLIFLDRVANYRIYKDDKEEPGKIAKIFEEEYENLLKKRKYKDLKMPLANKVHGGYFSIDKGKFKDTKGDSKSDISAYEKILKNKEALLNPDEPLRFIFSHSALQEGWDNPNVFQICSLRESNSEIRRRQEIGRGLRIPIDKNGNRIYNNKSINVLTIIANESYENYAKHLQKDFENETGIKFGIVKDISFANIENNGVEIGQENSKKIFQSLVENKYLDNKGEIQDIYTPKASDFELKISNEFENLKPQIIDKLNSFMLRDNFISKAVKEKITRTFNKEVYLSDDFKLLWDKISSKTRYQVSYDTNKLIDSAVAIIKDLNIEAPTIKRTKASVDITEAGIEAIQNDAYEIDIKNTPQKYPNILWHIQNETKLTRKTIYEIIRQSGRLDDFINNPQTFKIEVTEAIKQALKDILVDGIKYIKIPDSRYEMKKFEDNLELEVVSDESYTTKQNKSIYDIIECDSNVENKFARDLDNHDRVKLFVKLPRWFLVKTPIGDYNPDWAFVTHGEEKLYFVRETKGSTDTDELRKKEKLKIDYAKKHFKALDVNYDVVKELREVKIK